ncbi:MAG: single-stranded DNA-binding protein [Humidesulfovibrio sp.]|uniref:single-stranded DNA-binding protein n=1 Tax=Humidesulfovibrio sp. TaxID=2910988 RepID=UPI0027F6BE2D|nr:single-stranded DNA-binding protein [Humidesulfovibrio sp.]MDQ7834066.1 single-stranded DNA-binding protein [Humidesulfovibrio sp.]
MAGSLNKVILVGHLGQDPKISYAQSGLPIANMRLATSERIRDKDGQFTERTDWHTVVTFDKQADFCGKYLAKGSLIMVEGRLQTRKWQDKDGQDRYSTEVVAQRVQALGPRPGGGQGGGQGSEGGYAPRQQGGNQYGGQQNQQRGGGQNPPFHDDEDLGPAFPSEASGMDDVPF